jgi:hypothetical protein
LLPENDIKELLSQRYIELIANFNGYLTIKPDKDFGVDLEVKEVSIRENYTIRYSDTGKRLDIQLNLHYS